MCHKRLTWLVETTRCCYSLRNGRNYKSLERACALLEGSGQEMIDACAVKAKPIRKNAKIVTERDIPSFHIHTFFILVYTQF